MNFQILALVPLNFPEVSGTFLEGFQILRTFLGVSESFLNSSF